MKLTPSKTPFILKRLFPNYVWDMAAKDKTLYLTFDDGPTPDITPWVLKQLSLYNAKATFFCIGNNIEKHPELFKQVVAAGHAIGNHTYNHLKGWKTATPIYIDNVRATEQIIRAQVPNLEPQPNKAIKLFRPPYGKLTPKQGKALLAKGYKIIMWDVLSFDWDQRVSKTACLNDVLTNSNSGSIIVFHDSKKAARNMQYALPKTLAYFTEKGYVFKTLTSEFLKNT